MKTSNARSIGIFVVISLALLALFVILFGKSQFMENERYFVAYFPGSVNGLSIGAPVKFRGVEIGEVTMVEGVYDDKANTVTPRVTLSVIPERLTNVSLKKDDEEELRGLFAKGMRASLKSQSMLTGKLYVSLDFYKNAPMRRLANPNEKYMELPTVETGLSKFMTDLENLDVNGAVSKAMSALDRLDRILGNENINRSIDELPVTIGDIRATSQELRSFAGNNLPAATGAMEGFFGKAGTAVDKVSGKLDTGLLDRLDKTLTKVDTTLDLAQRRLDRNDPVSQEIIATLREVSDSANAVRRLGEYLEAHPEALVKGREGEK